jgi:predicted AAA+ superfamily ATPase
VYLSEHPEEELDAYVNTYLKEEILAEGLIRRLPPFSRFLKTIALDNGEMINFTKLANDSQDPVSVRTDDILCNPWQRFLSDLWKDKFL